MYDWIYFRVTGKTVVGILSWISSKTVKKIQEKNSNVAISSVNCLVYCLDERELTHKLAKRQDAF